VAVYNHLASLRSGTCNTGSDNECVKAHLEKLNEVLTGQAVCAAGFLEDALELCLTDAVLGTKTLLLAKTNGVVRVRLALGATVLTRRIGALFEVLGCLGREGNSQRARQAGLAAGT
jgi:hypothetical protein